MIATSARIREGIVFGWLGIWFFSLASVFLTFIWGIIPLFSGSETIPSHYPPQMIDWFWHIALSSLVLVVLCMVRQLIDPHRYYEYVEPQIADQLNSIMEYVKQEGPTTRNVRSA
jgi:hypothetical protein